MRISYQREDGKFYWVNYNFNSNQTSEQIFQILEKKFRKILETKQKDTTLNILRSRENSKKERIALVALILFYYICKVVSRGGVVIVLSDDRTAFCLSEEMTPVSFWEHFNMESQGIRFSKIDNDLIINLPSAVI